METLLTILEHLILSLAGLLIYSLIAVKDYLRSFSFNKFWKENKIFWIWAFSLQFLFALIIGLVPDSASAIKTLSGLDLSESMAFLSSGGVLAGLANWATGKTTNKGAKIGSNSVKDERS
jgi:hypothetical protein